MRVMHLCSGMAPVTNDGLEIHDSYQCVSLPSSEFVCRRWGASRTQGNGMGVHRVDLRLKMMKLSSWFYVSSLLLMYYLPS